MTKKYREQLVGVAKAAAVGTHTEDQSSIDAAEDIGENLLELLDEAIANLPLGLAYEVVNVVDTGVSARRNALHDDVERTGDVFNPPDDDETNEP
jgi:hypothetical protein